MSSTSVTGGRRARRSGPPAAGRRRGRGESLDDLRRPRPRPAGRARARGAAAAAGCRPRSRGRRGGSGPRVISAPTILRVARVDGHGQAEPDARDGGVDADDAAAAVGERAARVAGVERGVGLDHVVDDAARSAVGSERPSAETTPAVTEPAKPFGLPIATTSWPTRSRSASPSSAGDEVVGLGAQHGEIRERVGADDLEAAARGRRRTRRARRVAARDHVRRGEHEAVRRDHDRAAAAVQRRPPRRETRRFATDGASRSATEITARE